jgi:hypothetical protein
MINGEDVKKGEDIVIFRGQDLVVEPTIRKLTGKPVCLIIELKKPSIKEKPKYDLISADGTQTYLYRLEDNVQPVSTRQLPAEMYSCGLTKDEENKEYNKGKSCKDVIGTKYVWYKIIGSSKTTEHYMMVRFEDKWNKSNNRGIDDDKDATVFDGEITISPDSEDIMIFNGENKKISEWWNNELNALILESEGIKLRIHAVEFNKKMEYADYNLKVGEAKEDGEQRWTLMLSLHHKKDGSIDCSTYGDIISYQGRTQKEIYYIKIQRKAAAFKPKVSIDIKKDVLPIKDLPLKIKASITSAKEIDKANYELRIPEYKNFKRVKGEIKLEDCGSHTVSGLNRKDCEIALKEEDLSLGEKDLGVAGEYYITIEVKDKDRNLGKATKKFNVNCYKGNDWGDCEKECGSTSEVISNPELSCAENYKCCKQGQIA